jgi:hypothetical protein
MTLSITMKVCDTHHNGIQHDDTQHEGHSVYSVVMLNDIMPRVVLSGCRF